MNTLLMILPLYFPPIELYIRPLAPILLNKMVLLKENIVIFLRLQDHSCYLLMFQGSIGGSYTYNNLWCELDPDFILFLLVSF